MERTWIEVPRAGFEPAISRLRTGCPWPLDERGDVDDEANSGIRTRGLDHGGVALCQLSYVRKNQKCPVPGAQCPGSASRREKRGRRDSNPQPPERQSGALPVELRPHPSPHQRTHALTHFRTSHFRTSVQHGGRESNPQPQVLETSALPVELPPYVNREASAGSRTPGLVLTMDALCRLSYGSVVARERSGPSCRAAPRERESRATVGGGRRPSGPPSRLAILHENP